MSLLTEIEASLKRVKGMITPEEIFEYSADVDRINIYRFKMVDFFARFGLDIKPINIKQIDNDTILVPTTYQIHGGSITTRMLEKFKNEIKENQFVDTVNYDENTGDIVITFLKYIMMI